MNIKKRILSMVLAAATVFSSVALLSACDNEKEDGSQDTSSSESATQVEEAMPDIEKKNYGDQFYLHVLPDVNPPKYYFAEESQGDILTDAIYTRQEQVYQHIGVEIIGAKTGNFKEYLEPFKTSVKSLVLFSKLPP
jgi:protein involved in sex pheromone biosynthesis